MLAMYPVPDELMLLETDELRRRGPCFRPDLRRREPRLLELRRLRRVDFDLRLRRG